MKPYKTFHLNKVCRYIATSKFREYFERNRQRSILISAISVVPNRGSADNAQGSVGFFDKWKYANRSNQII